MARVEGTRDLEMMVVPEQDAVLLLLARNYISTLGPYSTDSHLSESQSQLLDSCSRFLRILEMHELCLFLLPFVAVLGLLGWCHYRLHSYGQFAVRRFHGHTTSVCSPQMVL